jgi:hypothetical protein
MGTKKGKQKTVRLQWLTVQSKLAFISHGRGILLQLSLKMGTLMPCACGVFAVKGCMVR